MDMLLWHVFENSGFFTNEILIWILTKLFVLINFLKMYRIYLLALEVDWTFRLDVGVTNLESCFLHNFYFNDKYHKPLNNF